MAATEPTGEEALAEQAGTAFTEGNTAKALELLARPAAVGKLLTDSMVTGGRSASIKLRKAPTRSAASPVASVPLMTKQS